MEQSSARSRASWPIPVVAALFALSALVLVVTDDKGQAGPEPRPASAETTVDLASLPESTTHTRIKGAPKDPRPGKLPKGTVVHPKKVLPLYDAPDGKPFAKIGPRQFGDTWLPVITRNRDWVQVLLPSKPNGSTGWLRSSQLAQAHSRFLVRVDLGERSLELLEDNRPLGRWSVAIGASKTPTPTGRTFVLGQLVDDKQPFSPVILPLGTHSATLDSYGGGPGTVALHGWTDPSVFGKAVSHGCVRVPDDALEALRQVPIGTPVLVKA
ncbi:L,D-transpeptidase [Nocardioides sp. zg-536]|uniref:L,D-transpeptidase n=1 Tax=Nocardioides faecalis TaxID=2803858 RepID=A0A938Y6U5_9ACTN|nr:L,D-transpeptidase [Nocardioides faecalis]MBM9460274.1 L,D-transpeptidase [Nocardioides faecalis]QVI59885.1 L,D-transpeptidase [Nocardioides faecalis]